MAVKQTDGAQAPDGSRYVTVTDGVGNLSPAAGGGAITSVIPGTGATNLGKAEDTPHVSSDTGVFTLGIANEAQNVLVSADGDYIGTSHDTKGNLYLADGKPIAPVSVSSAATLFTITDTSGYGSVSVQVTSAGTTCTVSYEASEDGVTWTSVNGVTPTVGNSNTSPTTTTTIGTNWWPLVSKQFRARVSTYTSGTVTVQATMRKDPLPRQSLNVGGGNVGVTGTNTDGTAVAAVGLLIGYEARTTNKTATASAQFVRPVATTIGVAVNKPYQVPELDWSFASAAGGIVNTSDNVLVAAAGAGIRNYLTGISIQNASATISTEVVIKDGSTIIWRGFVGTSALLNSAVGVTFPSPLKTTANTALNIACITTAAAVYVNAQGYQAP